MNQAFDLLPLMINEADATGAVNIHAGPPPLLRVSQPRNSSDQIASCHYFESILWVRISGMDGSSVRGLNSEGPGPNLALNTHDSSSDPSTSPSPSRGNREPRPAPEILDILYLLSISGIHKDVRKPKSKMLYTYLPQ